MSTLRILFPIILIACSIVACSEGDKKAASALVMEAVKSSDQKSAEQICWNEAASAESRRTPGLRRISGLPPETTILSKGHYLIAIQYKRITVDDPGERSNNLCMYGSAKCEVRDGVLLGGKIDEMPRLCQ